MAKEPELTKERIMGIVSDLIDAHKQIDGIYIEKPTREVLSGNVTRQYVKNIYTGECEIKIKLSKRGIK